MAIYGASTALASYNCGVAQSPLPADYETLDWKA